MLVITNRRARQYCTVLYSTVQYVQYCTVLMQQYCCNSTVATVLLQQYCCNSTVATVLSQQYGCNSTVEHWCNRLYHMLAEACRPRAAGPRVP